MGIEVKAAASVNGADFRGLRHLARLLGPHFVRGVVFYTGPASIQVGDDDRFRAVPVDALWTTGDPAEPGGS